MALEWKRIRDEVTCEVYHRLWDHNLSKNVVFVNQINKMYRVQVLDHVPFHTSKLKLAKEVGQLVYEQVGQ